ncbi:MAG: hypothetical protein LQ338_006531, partial [Usnochroma carphineum]
MEGYDKINDCTGSITDNVPNNVPADVPNHVTENITNITKDITNATDKVTTVTENVTNPTENISHCIPVSGESFASRPFSKTAKMLSVAGGKKPLTFDGDQSRFVKGARPQGEDDDLRPPPLRFGEKSLAEMLSEAPPEGFREPSVTSPTAKSPAARSPATQSASAGSTNTTPKSGNFKKGRLISRPSLASVRRLFSPKQKHSEAFEDSVELTGGVTSQGSPLRRKTIPVVTQQDAFGIASPTGSQLSGHDLPPPCMSPDSNVFMTAFPSTSTSSSSGMSPFEIELAAQTSFSSNKKSSATTPTHSSRGPSSSFTTSTNPSPGKIYGQPPPSMTRPIIPHRVTEEHLRLTSFPPVSKEDLAKLPKDIEPTLPSPELSPFASRHCSQPTSLKHVSSISPDREGSAGLSLTKSVGNLGAFKDDENVFNYPAQSVKRLPTLRHAYSTASIAGMPETAEQLSRYPLPRLNLKWKKEVEKYNHNSPTARTPDAVEYGDGQGHSVTVAKHAPPGSISAARRKAEMAKEALRLGISSPGFAQTPVDDQATHQSRFSPESCDSPIRTPVTPKSGNVTPSFPDFKEFYENLSKIHSNGSAKSSP